MGRSKRAVSATSILEFLAARGLAASLSPSARGSGPGAPANDACADAITISTQGKTPFTTIGATTDGSVHAACDFCCGDPQINHDVWFQFTALNTTGIDCSICQSNYDTKIAVYEGCGCPAVDSALLACNDDYCGLASSVMFDIVAGNCYTVRVGGFQDSQGSGILDFNTIPIEMCGGADHDCCTPGEIGCDDVACCEYVCSVEPFCCMIEWDSNCVALAYEQCVDIGCRKALCTPDHPHDCFTVGVAGCNDVACCEQVCCVDPFCCASQWDQQCVNEAQLYCIADCPVSCDPGMIPEFEFCGDHINDGCEFTYFCDGFSGNCCRAHPGPGCEDRACEASVCFSDPHCCETDWDAICQALACNDENCGCEVTTSKAWQNIDCGQTICGQIYSEFGIRDEDWFLLWVDYSGTVVNWSVASESPVEILITNFQCHALETLASAQGVCMTTTSAKLESGSYLFGVRPLHMNCLPCGDNNDYIASLSCVYPPCSADISLNGLVDVDDLLAVINGWGPCVAQCPADIAPQGTPPGDGMVNVDDLLMVINNWGVCPP